MLSDIVDAWHATVERHRARRRVQRQLALTARYTMRPEGEHLRPVPPEIPDDLRRALGGRKAP